MYRLPAAREPTTISSVIHEWQTFGRRYRLCRVGLRIDGWSELSMFDARWALRTPLSSPHTSRALLNALLGDDRGSLSANPDVLERAMHARCFIVLEQPIADVFPSGAPAVPAPEAEPRSHQPRRELAWIDITVVDDSVPPRPMSGIRFGLSLPDGSRRQGTLDGQGHLRVENIDPGKCFLELADLRTGRKA